MADTPFSNPLESYSVTEPSLDEFEVIAAKAFRRLPKKFRALYEDVVIRVEDFPTDEVLHRMTPSRFTARPARDNMPEKWLSYQVLGKGRSTKASLREGLAPTHGRPWIRIWPSPLSEQPLCVGLPSGHF